MEIDKKNWLMHCDQLYQFHSIYDTNKHLSKYIYLRNIISSNMWTMT